MKKFTLYTMVISIFLLLVAGLNNQVNAANGLDPITTIIDKSQASGNLPAIIDNAGANRGAGFNGEYVFVASRQDGNHVYYWDVNDTGADPMELNLTGVAGGTFVLSDLAVVSDHVFVSNMVFVGGTFKVYHWAGVNAVPTILLEYPDAPARLGDAFTVLGNPASEALLIVSGHGSKNFYVWTIQNGAIPVTEPAVYNFENVLSVNFGRVTKVPGEDLFLASGSAFGLLLLDSEMNVLAEVESAFFPYWSLYPQIFHFNGQRFMAYIHVKDTPGENMLYILDINDGENTVAAIQSLAQATFAERVVRSVSLGSVPNGNASAGLDLISDAAGNLWAMAYAAGNGFLVEKYGDAVPVSFEPITTILDKSQASGMLPAIIDNAGANRGAGFNGEYVFVASRQNGNHVYYWDLNDPGADQMELDLTGIAGGTFVLSDLAVSGDHIFVSNMVFVGGTFKVYHWSGVNALPAVILEYPDAPARLGDAFTVIGNPASDALLIVSGHGSKNFYVWNIVGGTIPEINPTIYTFEDVLSVNFGRVTKVPGENLFLASGSAFGLLLLDSEMNVLAEVESAFFPYWSLHPQIFYFNGQRLLAYIHVKDTPAENMLYILDINQGANAVEAIESLAQATFAERIVHSVSLGTVSNGNASVGLDMVSDALGNLWAMAYAAGNGFVVEKYGDAEPASLEPIFTILDKTQANGNMPDIINNAGANRGAGFNGEYVFVASRQDGNHVYYWPVAEPESDPMELDLTGVSGGTFVLSDLAVSGDHIFVSNMVFVGGTFKVYHWAGVNAAPVVILEYAAAPARLGDAFTVLGNPDDEALLIVSGHGSKSFHVWTIQNGEILNTTPEVYTFDEVPHVNFGRITKVPGDEDLFLASGSGFGLLLLDNQMNVLTTVQAGFFPYWSMYPQIFYYNNQRFLAYIHVKDTPAENMLYILDINSGATVLEAIESMAQSTFANRLVHSVSLGSVANGNASVGLDIIEDELGNVWVMGYAAGNGFIVQRFGDATGTFIRQPSLSTFSVYPNPANSWFTILAESQIREVMIFDITGKLIERMQAGNTQVAIDAANFINGIYLISVTTDQGVSGNKLIIQK